MGPPPPLPVSSREAGVTIDEGKGRVFPCEGCGADLTFDIGAQQLECPFCGYQKPIELAADAVVAERELLEALARESDRRTEGAADLDGVSEVRCTDCGANVVFSGTLTSDECPYCGTPVQRENVHDATDRIPADGVLPFLVERETARKNLSRWVLSRWFAPSQFKTLGVRDRFHGVYLPYWTYDALTSNHYHGQRGEHYYVTVGSGKDRRQERRTRWYPASGSFRRFFDDVLVVAGEGLPRKRLDDLEPWPLDQVVPFNKQMLAGFLARTYDVSLEDGFREAEQRIASAIDADVRRRIGGDVQTVSSINTQYRAQTYKHLLLPVWMLAYKYHDKSYQVVVNAATGEVQGDRPWSVWKIICFSLAVLVVGAGIFFAAGGAGAFD